MKKGEIYMPSKEFFDLFNILGQLGIIPVGLLAIQSRNVLILPIYWILFLAIMSVGASLY